MKTKNFLLILVLILPFQSMGEPLRERLDALKSAETTLAADAFRKEIRLRTGLRQGIGMGKALQEEKRSGEGQGLQLRLERQKYRDEGGLRKGLDRENIPGNPGMGRR